MTDPIFQNAYHFQRLILKRLPKEYYTNENDLAWLRLVAFFWSRTETNQAILNAFFDATKMFGVSIHIDPYELAIDAGICDSKLKIL